MKKAIFTIANDSYEHQVASLRESFEKYTPTDSIDFYWIRLERNGEKPYKWCVNSSEILGYTLASYSQYSIVEAATAIKPRVFRSLFDASGYDELMYIDPDIVFFQDVNNLFEKLKDCDAGLTPHLLKPYDDDKAPTDLQILKSGSYNLGFLYLRKCKDSSVFVNWWLDKTLLDCMEVKIDGIFTDQKWCEYIPSFIGNTKIIKSPGWNVAYWNLHERRIHSVNGVYYVNDELLAFMHFSGCVDPSTGNVSKHSSRGVEYLTKDGLDLYIDYNKKVTSRRGKGAGWTYDIKVGYSDTVLNTTLRHALNDILRDNPELIYQISRDEDVIKLICKTNGRELPPFIYALLSERKDVAAAYLPEIRNGNIRPLIEWIKNSGKNEIPGIELLPILYEKEKFVNFIGRIYAERDDVRKAYPAAFSSVHHFRKFVDWIDNSLRKEYKVSFSKNQILEESGITALLKIDCLILLRPDLVAALKLKEPGAANRLINWIDLRTNKNLLSRIERSFFDLAFKYNKNYLDYRLNIRSLGVSFGFARDVAFGKVDLSNEDIFKSIKTDNVSILDYLSIFELVKDAPAIKFNYYSYFYANSGLGIAARNLQGILSKKGININNIPIPSMLGFSPLDMGFEGLADFEINLSKSSNPGDINFYHCNFDVINRTTLSDAVVNVAYSVWELAAPSAEVLSNIGRFDLVYVPSKFVKKAFDISGINTHVLSHNLSNLKFVNKKIKNKNFELNYAYFFDVASVIERKNPFLLIDAFEKAFGVGVGFNKLILKINRAEDSPHYVRKLIARTIDNKNIKLIFSSIDSDSMEKLWDRVDVYVSPHRAEGFGLTIMEAMQRSIPVITTSYSGLPYELPKNTFMAVDFKEEYVKPGCSPYSVNSKWADVDCDSLAHCLKKIQRTEVRQQLSINAKKYINEKYSDEVIWISFVKTIQNVRSKFTELNSRI